MEAGTLGLLLMGLGLLPAMAPPCGECGGSGCPECATNLTYAEPPPPTDAMCAAMERREDLIRETCFRTGISLPAADLDEHDQHALDRFADEGGN